MRTTQWRWLAGASVVSLFALAACGGGSEAPPASDQSWDAVVARANEQELVRVYTTAVPNQMQSLADAFEEDHPDITVEVVRDSVSNLYARIDAEVAGGQDGADIFFVAGPTWYDSNADKLIELDTPAVTDWPEDAWAGGPQKAATVGIAPTGFLVWNTDVFPDGFDTWADVLEEDIEGKVGVYDSIDISAATFYAFITDLMGESFLESIAGESPRFYPSVLPLTQAVASGEIALGFNTHLDVIRELQDSGAPLDYALPKEGAYAANYNAGVVSSAKRQDAAKVFMDYFMTPAGQEAFNRVVGASVLDGIPDTVDTEQLQVLGDPPYEFGPDDVTQWQDRFREIFRR